MHWKRVDDLLSKQDDVMKKIGELNNKTQPSVEKVTQFLNESSPRKKKSSSEVASVPGNINVDCSLMNNESESDGNTSKSNEVSSSNK